MHLNLPERELANELAYLVAAKMLRDLEPSKHGGLYNMGQSNYEAGCYALNLVGVFQQAAHYTVHEVVVPLDGIRQHMEGLDHVSREALNELLSAFIENYVTYEGILSGWRGAYSAHKSLQKVLNLLVATGFAEKQADQYKWTTKIQPIMQHWYIWDENGVVAQFGREA
jgi:hypothetical protein